MRELKLLELTEAEIRQNYKLAEADKTGHSINEKKISFAFSDLGIKIKVEYKTSDALRIFFESRRGNGEFTNCTFDEFKEMWDEGYEVEDIEPELKKKKLDFGDGKKEE